MSSLAILPVHSAPACNKLWLLHPINVHVTGGGNNCGHRLMTVTMPFKFHSSVDHHISLRRLSCLQRSPSEASCFCWACPV